MRAEGAVPIIGTIERVAEHGGGNPVQAVTLSGAWILSDRTSLDVLSKTKSAWAAIMEPTSVPWGSLRRLVAEVTGSSRTKFSPPTTEPERAPTTGHGVHVDVPFVEQLSHVGFLAELEECDDRVHQRAALWPTRVHGVT